MNKQNLLEDLINDFQEEKESLKSKIDLMDPMATSIRLPAATRLLNKTILIITEILVWILILGSIALVIFMDTIYPFHILRDISTNPAVTDTIRSNDIELFSWAMKGILIFAILLLFWISRMLVKIRHKNDVLQLAGKNMKTLVEQFFQRRSTMENLENKYPIDLPTHGEGIYIVEPELRDSSISENKFQNDSSELNKNSNNHDDRIL